MITALLSQAMHKLPLLQRTLCIATPPISQNNFSRRTQREVDTHRMAGKFPEAPCSSKDSSLNFPGRMFLGICTIGLTSPEPAREIPQCALPVARCQFLLASESTEEAMASRPLPSLGILRWLSHLHCSPL